MPSIRNFSGGVLNQELQNLDNGNGVLFDCKNVLSSWNGELRKRTGTRLLKGLEGDSKIIPYRLPDGDDMIMILRDKVINCYKFDDDGNLVPYTTITGGADIPFPTIGWSNSENGDWIVSNSGTFSAQGAVSLDDPSMEYMEWSVDEIKSHSAYYVIENANPFVFSSCVVHWVKSSLSSDVGVLCGVEPVLQYSDDGTNWTPIQTTVSPKETNYWKQGKYYYVDVNYTIQNNVYGAAHKYWRIFFSDSYTYRTEPAGITRMQLRNIKTVSQITETNLIFNNCPYENEDFDNIRWSQNFVTLTMACKGKQPYQITISGGVFNDSLFTPSDYTTLWSVMGYPACVTYYQNRLWFGGFNAFPTRVFGSAFSEFDKFSIPSPMVATSPIMADGTEISNIIENMWGGNNALYCLSADGISMIDAQNSIVATNQIEFKLRNREPVNAMVPTVKDDIMIYLGRDKRKILITDYDFVVQRFKANCISDNYNDFLQSGIKELHYIPRRSSLIYGVLENGKWFAMLFNIDKQKNALFPFETSGIIKDVQPIKKGDETKLLILTQLPTYQYVLEEKLPQADQEIMDFMTTQEKEDYTASVLNSNQAYLDHSISRNFDYPATRIGNLPYIGGEQIEVIADGQYIGSKEVLSSENSNLYAWSGTYVKNGIRYNTILYTDEENPNTSSIIYDENYSDKIGFSIREVVESGGNVIQIYVSYSALMPLLGYKKSGAEPENVYLTSLTAGAVFDENGNSLGLATSHSSSQLVFNGVTYDRDSSIDTEAPIRFVNIFDKDAGSNISVSSSYVELDNEFNKVILGYKYDSYAVLKFITPYTERKFPKEIAVNFINTGYLEVGNTFDSLKSVLNNLVESVSISNKRILMNGNYAKTLDKHAFETPYVIVRSDKGLPFIITGIDYRVDMSNYQGGV